MPGRKFSSGSSYRFGFNGKEKDDEINGDGSSLDFGDRMYDSRLGRWLSIDPLTSKFPSLSPYNFVNNNPIIYVDVDGNEFIFFVKIKNEETGKNELQKVTFDGVNATMMNVKTGIVKDYKPDAPNADPFVNATIESYNYIVNSGADVDNAMQTIASSKNIQIEVQESNGKTDYTPNNSEPTNPTDGFILYDPSSGLSIEDEKNESEIGLQSPAIGFWGEVYHAYIDKVDGEAKKLYPKRKDQEEYVHGSKEKEVIDKIKKKDPTSQETKRNKYKQGTVPVKTKSSTSTTESRKK